MCIIFFKNYIPLIMQGVNYIMNSTNMEDIIIEYDDRYNPMVSSPNAPYGLPFYQTRDTLIDVETYKSFLDNAIATFRHSAFYKNYKSYLMSLGLDHCQLMSDITENEVGASGIEMNHNFLTIFDIALMITEHIINTIGYISTFDLVYILCEEHKANRIPIVMLSETAHEMYHQNDEMFLPASMCFGNWIELLQRYSKGITIRIAEKVSAYVNRSLNEEVENSNVIKELLEVKDYVEGWSMYNECGDNRRIGIVSGTGVYSDDMQYLETSDKRVPLSYNG